MARIRTIKPEFWIDETLTECSLGARLLFIALWNFADDQGYVDDKPKRIKAQVFPSDDIDVAPLLDELVERGRLVRYDSPIGPVLHIRNFDRHQRVDKPSKARFDPSSLSPREPSRPAEPSREVVPASLATEGKGSGREGKGREGIVPPTAGAIARRNGSPPATTETLLAEWISHCRKRPPENVIGQVGRQVRALLAEGQDPADVRAGLAAWHQKGVHPSVLPSVVNELMNASPRASPRASTTDTRVDQALRLAAELERQEIEA